MEHQKSSLQQLVVSRCRDNYGRGACGDPDDNNNQVPTLLTWNDIADKPSIFPPTPHNHDDKYYSQYQLDKKLLEKSDVTHSHAWDEMTNKPSTFPPEVHTHTWGQITGKPTVFNPSNHSHNWSDLTNVPLTFTPETHSHAWDTITNKPTAFHPEDHNHTWSQITGKPSTFTPSEHLHQNLLDVSIEQDAKYILAGPVSGKAEPTFRLLTATDLPLHEHTWSQITGKPSTFTPSTHSHAWDTITSKPESFTPEAHAHTWSQITDKPTSFPPSTHTHTGYLSVATAVGKNTVLAGPTSGDATRPSFRALTVSDLPNIASNNIDGFKISHTGLADYIMRQTRIGNAKGDNIFKGVADEVVSLFSQETAGGQCAQMVIDFDTGQLATRATTSAGEAYTKPKSWTPWRIQIDNQNFSKYITPESIGAAKTSDIGGITNTEFTTTSLGFQRNGTIGSYSIALGKGAWASNEYCIAIGQAATSYGWADCVIGHGSRSNNGSGAHNYAFGASQTIVGGNYNLALGMNNIMGLASSKPIYVEYGVAIGKGNYVFGDRGISLGQHLMAMADQLVVGHYNDTSTATAGTESGASDGTVFAIGNGTSSAKSNAFRVTGTGEVYSAKASMTPGADYAELVRWGDDNLDDEDRVGYFVTYSHGRTMRIANANDDDIIGIVSGNPAICGNADICWRGRFVQDDFGRYVMEESSDTVIDIDPITKETTTRTVPCKRYKESENYDPSKQYIQRIDRPEWDAVGMVGFLPVRDNGECAVDKYCTVGDGGIAVPCEYSKFKCYRVVERISKNVIVVKL